jgi:hypothetical protein
MKSWGGWRAVSQGARLPASRVERGTGQNPFQKRSFNEELSQRKWDGPTHRRPFPKRY